MHGLDCTGLSQKGPELLRKHVSKQARLLAKSPSHITHETSRALLQRLSIPDPVCDLQQRVCKRVHQVRTGQMSTLQPQRVKAHWNYLGNHLEGSLDPAQKPSRK